MCTALVQFEIPYFLNSSPCCLHLLPYYSGCIFSSRISICLQDPILLGLKKESDEKFQAQLYEGASAVYTFIVINYPFMDTVIADMKW